MSGVILKKSAGLKLPEKLVDATLPAFQNCIGAAAFDGKELKFVHSEDGADKEVFNMIQDDFVDLDVYYYMSDGKAKRTAIDLQPYSLLKDAKGNPLLMCFLTGNFDRWKAGGVNSPEWFAVESDLRSRIQDTFDICGSDIVKTMERIKTNVLFQRDVTNLWTEHGTILFLSNTGDTHIFEHNPKKLEANWGWTTNPLGYVEGTHETTASPKKFSVQNFRRAVADVISPDKKDETPARRPVPDDAPPAPVKAPAATPATAPPPAGRRPVADDSPPTAPETPQEGELIPQVVLTDDEVYYQVPDNVTNNKAIQALYRKETGFLPDDWKDRPKVKRSNRKLAVALRDKQAKQVKSVRSLQDIGKLPIETKTATAVPPTAGKRPVEATGKESEYPDTGTHNIPEGEVEVGILSAAQKKQLNELISDGKVVKIIDKHSKVVVDPAGVQAYEEKRPTFTDITGLDLDDMIFWPPQVVRMLIEDHPEGAERLITQAIYERYHMKELLNKKEGTASPPTSVPATRKAADAPVVAGRRQVM